MDYFGSKEIQQLFTLLAEVMSSQKEELAVSMPSSGMEIWA